MLYGPELSFLDNHHRLALPVTLVARACAFMSSAITRLYSDDCLYSYDDYTIGFVPIICPVSLFSPGSQRMRSRAAGLLQQSSSRFSVIQYGLV